MKEYKFNLYKDNPRKKTERVKSLKKNLDKYGDLSGIVHDINSDQIICGNQRTSELKFSADDIEIVFKREHPDEQGTIAVGFVISEGKRYNFRQVSWDEETIKEAAIVANTHAGEWDYEFLQDYDSSFLSEHGFQGWEMDLINSKDSEEDSEEDNSLYSKKIESPIYEPSNEKPKEADLFDDSKTKDLISKIKQADISESEKNFLIKAARRHTVFNYQKIADYYANSEKEVQELIEDSGLVIIDFKKAIELGYVSLSEEIAKKYLEEYGEEDQ